MTMTVDDAHSALKAAAPVTEQNASPPVAQLRQRALVPV